MHLPTVKRVYEESARLAERETLSYERYLLDLVTRETSDRQQKRIQRLLLWVSKLIYDIRADRSAAQAFGRAVCAVTKSLLRPFTLL